MNYNTKNIIQTYASITGNEDKNKILQILNRSTIFCEVRKGNPIFLHEGYTANILEIVKELKQSDNCPKEVHKITPEAVVMVNRSRRLETESKKGIFFGKFLKKTR